MGIGWCVLGEWVESMMVFVPLGNVPSPVVIGIDT